MIASISDTIRVWVGFDMVKTVVNYIMLSQSFSSRVRIPGAMAEAGDSVKE